MTTKGEMMLCWYQVKDNEWIKASMASTDGGRRLRLHPHNSDKPVLTLDHPELLFGAEYLIVTGYESAGPGVFRLESVFVAFSKPTLSKPTESD